MTGAHRRSPFKLRPRAGWAVWGIVAVLTASPLAAQASNPSPPAAAAPGAAAPDPVAALRAEVAALRADYEGRLAALESRLAELAAAGPAAAPPASVAAAPQTTNYFNPSMSVIGNFVAVGGSTSADELPAAELRESEIGLQAVIDPYARADFFLAFGEEGVEMEEGYATLTSLPASLLVRLGRMRAGFGKVNMLHSHTLPWADQPLPVANLLGGDEGWIGSGLSAAWLLPLGETFSEATLQVFRGDADGLFEARDRHDLAYNGHYRIFRDLTEATNVDLGVSYAFGPNGATESADTQLSGLDVTLRWKPLQTALYRSATLRGEVVRSRREEPGDTIDALGWFVSGDWQLARRWAIGARLEASERPYDASLRDRGEAALLTFRPSEFSLVRGELRRRRFSDGVTATELLLQYQFAIGAHSAHPF